MCGVVTYILQGLLIFLLIADNHPREIFSTKGSISCSFRCREPIPIGSGKFLKNGPGAVFPNHKKWPSRRTAIFTEPDYPSCPHPLSIKTRTETPYKFPPRQQRTFTNHDSDQLTQTAAVGNEETLISSCFFPSRKQTPPPG